MQSVCLVYTTWPDRESAKNAACQLVEEGLCACANLLPGMTSVYRWQGVIETAAECVALFKTTTVAAGALRDRLLTLHPYDEPAIIALPVEGEASSTGFLDWITAQVAARPVSPTDRKA